VFDKEFTVTVESKGSQAFDLDIVTHDRINDRRRISVNNKFPKIIWRYFCHCRPSPLSSSSQGAIFAAHVPHRIPSLINSRAMTVLVGLKETGF
jgi:hypothetical protein